MITVTLPKEEYDDLVAKSKMSHEQIVNRATAAWTVLIQTLNEQEDLDHHSHQLAQFLLLRRDMWVQRALKSE